MTYYADFSLYDYDYYSKPEGLTIGWLERGFDFPVGDVSVDDWEILSDLASLKQKKSRGVHHCTFCADRKDQWGESSRFDSRFVLGGAEIRVTSDDGELYIAPDLILHYILDHRYRPPEQFLAAARDEARRLWG
ncbi:hypothetical protein [Streptomyces sp. NPDC047928]|uniref:DUF7919 family protein n=1 Tax=unclassified Streptomyces TaxID=2593676 RepID=UPI0037172016